MAKRDETRKADWVVSHGQPVYAVAHAKATVRGDSTVDADLTRLEEQVGSTGSFKVWEVTLTPEAWTETDDGVRAVIPVAGTTSRTVPLIFINTEDIQTSLQCGLKPEVVSGPGTVTAYAMITPNDLIRMTILAMFSQDAQNDVELTGPDAPSTAYYKMPVATKDTLGGVKIGANIDIAEDGTISVKGGAGCNHVLSGGLADGSQHIHDDECLKELVALPGEVEDALNRALGIDTDPA